MNTILSKMAGTGLFFLFIFLSGFWLKQSGKPYNTALFTVHKLIALGALIFLVVIVNKVHQSVPFHAVEITAIAVTALFFAATIVTGGLLSIDKEVPAFIHKLHQVTPFLTIVSCTAALYLLLFQSGNLIQQ